MSYTHSDCTLFGIELPVWALCTDPFIIPNRYSAGNFCQKEKYAFYRQIKKIKIVVKFFLLSNTYSFTFFIKNPQKIYLFIGPQRTKLRVFWLADQDTYEE